MLEVILFGLALSGWCRASMWKRRFIVLLNKHSLAVSGDRVPGKPMYTITYLEGRKTKRVSVEADSEAEAFRKVTSSATPIRFDKVVDIVKL